VVACAECGYVYEELPVREIAGTLRSFGHKYGDALGGASAVAASKRPRRDVWSALEYACHVRDVFLVQRERVVLAQVEDRPSFVRMYRDERVPLCGYSTSSLETVVDQLRMAAELCGSVFAGLQESSWSRTFLYNWPSTDAHDLAWLGRHTVHEGVHHLMDVGRVLTQVT
jgi:DNA segregation ATPase FtsK/SpoIIIE, S-DNA-T family